jgi:FtsH-binding integral membrane protein
LIPEEKGDNSEQLKKPAKVVTFAEAVEVAELTVKQNEREKCLKTFKWVTFGLLAGLCMGVGAFLYATNFGDLGINGLGMIGPGTFLVLFTVRLSIQIHYRAKHGRWFKS